MVAFPKFKIRHERLFLRVPPFFGARGARGGDVAPIWQSASQRGFVLLRAQKARDSERDFRVFRTFAQRRREKIEGFLSAIKEPQRVRSKDRPIVILEIRRTGVERVENELSEF